MRRRKKARGREGDGGAGGRASGRRLSPLAGFRRRWSPLAGDRVEGVGEGEVSFRDKVVEDVIGVGGRL